MVTETWADACVGVIVDASTRTEQLTLTRQ
jgi:hypothetical protein